MTIFDLTLHDISGLILTHIIFLFIGFWIATPSDDYKSYCINSGFTYLEFSQSCYDQENRLNTIYDIEQTLYFKSISND